MFHEIRIRPRISETDLMGHINNVAVAAWFEEGRTYMTGEFAHTSAELPPFILARIEIDYEQQIFFGQVITIRSAVERIGTSSIGLYQELWQQSRRCAMGRSVLVHFNPETQRSQPLPDALREGFLRFLETPVPRQGEAEPGSR